MCEWEVCVANPFPGGGAGWPEGWLVPGCWLAVCLGTEMTRERRVEVWWWSRKYHKPLGKFISPRIQHFFPIVVHLLTTCLLFGVVGRRKYKKPCVSLWHPNSMMRMEPADVVRYLREVRLREYQNCLWIYLPNSAEMLNQRKLKTERGVAWYESDPHQTQIYPPWVTTIPKHSHLWTYHPGGPRRVWFCSPSAFRICSSRGSGAASCGEGGRDTHGSHERSIESAGKNIETDSLLVKRW